MRLSSPSLAAAFIDGVTTQGVHVTDYGLAGTDMMYYAVASAGLDGGAQITASHNPKQYNGCKLVRAEAFPLSGESGIREMKEMMLAGTLPAPAATRGSVTAGDIMAPYVEHVMGFIDPAVIQPFNTVLDAGSGIAGAVAPHLFDRLPCRTTRLCFEVDGTFPNHEANPLIEENRADIVAEVRRQSADVGIAWDGDADRCFFIDGSGEFVAGDFITALLAEAFLMRQPGATIIYDVRASYAVKDVVARYGGTALMNRVGHAFIKRRMREEDAVFGGEVTGHYYFKDNFYADNGFIPALLILELMSRKGKSLRDLLAPLRERYFISGEINTKVASMAVGAREARAAGPRVRPRKRLPPRRHLSRVRRLALQRPGVEHRAAAAPESRGHDARDHGAAARRGARHHPRLADRPGVSTGRVRESRLAARVRLRSGDTAVATALSRVPRPSPQTRRVTFPVTGMTCAACQSTVERALTRTAGRQRRQRQPDAACGHGHLRPGASWTCRGCSRPCATSATTPSHRRPTTCSGRRPRAAAAADADNGRLWLEGRRSACSPASPPWCSGCR